VALFTTALDFFSIICMLQVMPGDAQMAALKPFLWMPSLTASTMDIFVDNSTQVKSIYGT